MSKRTPTLQSRSQFHSYWGQYTSTVTLPNALYWVGTSDQVAALEAGDTAFVTSAGLFQCMDPGTPGSHDAVWTQIGGTSSYSQAEIDFGEKPIFSAEFEIFDPAVTTSSTIVVLPTSLTATGRVGNDAAWDQLVMSAAPNTGSFTLSVTLVPGPVVGRRIIQYQVL